MFKTCQFCGKVYKTYYSNSMFCSILVVTMQKYSYKHTTGYEIKN